MGGNGDDQGMEKDPNRNEKSPNRESKHSRNEDTFMEDGTTLDKSSSEAPHDPTVHPNPTVEERIQAMAKDIIDWACDKVLNECANKVMGEQEVVQMVSEFSEEDQCFAGNMVDHSVASPAVVDAAMQRIAAVVQCRELPYPLRPEGLSADGAAPGAMPVLARGSPGGSLIVAGLVDGSDLGAASGGLAAPPTGAGVDPFPTVYRKEVSEAVVAELVDDTNSVAAGGGLAAPPTVPVSTRSRLCAARR